MGAGAAGGSHRCRHLQLLQRHLLVEIVKLTGAYRHVPYRIQHRLVVLLNQDIARRTYRLEIGVQAAAIEYRQIQPRQQVNLLEGRLKQIADAQRVISPKGFNIKMRIKGSFRRIYLAHRSGHITAQGLQIRATRQQFEGE